jgi:hypothetical protein
MATMSEFEQCKCECGCGAWASVNIFGKRLAWRCYNDYLAERFGLPLASHYAGGNTKKVASSSEQMVLFGKGN